MDLISLGDQGNKSSIDTLINDPIVLGIPRNPSQILLGDAPIVLIESLGKTVTTWSFFLVHLKNCSLNFLFGKKVFQQSDSLLRYWRPIQPFYPPRILVRFVVKTTKETQKLLINTLLILQFEPFLRGDLENFFFLLPLATLWKYLRVVTPSLTHFTLVLCLKCTSSLCSNSFGSIFLTSLNATNLLIKALSLS